MTQERSDEQLFSIINKAIDKNDTVCGLKRDVDVLKSDVGSLKFETKRLGVFIEDIYDKINIILETVVESRKIMDRLDGHEHRISLLEESNSLLKNTVKHHSSQLNSLRPKA